jgi:YggT family protein
MDAGNAFFAAMLDVISIVLNFYIWALIIGAVLSWLVAFNVVNNHNRVVQVVGDFLYRITEPLLRPIRRVIPSINGIDLSPLVLIFIIYFVQSFLHRLVY